MVPWRSAGSSEERRIEEQEQAFARLEAAVAAGRERIAELEAQTELAEELVASLQRELVGRRTWFLDWGWWGSDKGSKC